MFIRQFDYLSPPITFYHKGYLKHSSILSGLFSIISFIIIISLTIYYSLEIIESKNPTAYFLNRYIEDAGIYPLNSSSLFHFLSLSIFADNHNEEGVDFKNFRIIGFKEHLGKYIGNRNLKDYDHWLYGFCNNGSDIEGINSLINYEFFQKSACIRKYYDKNDEKYYDTKDPKFKWPVIAHGNSNNNSIFYTLVLESCKEDTIKLILGNDAHCNSNDIFKTSIRGGSRARFYYIDNYVDISKKEKPITKFISKIENIIQSNINPIIHLNFNPTFLSSHNGLIFDKQINYSTYIYEKNDIYTFENKDDIYTGYYLWLNNRQNYYERIYKRFQDIFSQIGGIYQFVTIISIFINRLYNNFVILKDTENLLFSTNKPKKSKTEKKLKEIDNKKIDHNIKDNNNNQKNNNEKIIDEKNDKILQKRTYNNKNFSILKSNDNIMSKDEIFNISNQRLDKTYDKDYKKKCKTMLPINPKRNKKTFSSFLLFKFSCRKKNIFFQKLEDFREKIISEEYLIKNYLNTYNLLRNAEKKPNFKRNRYHIYDLLILV